ncbi:hypothetical protein FHS25_001528 [Rhizobium laguerreae]|uniref:Transposase DDE domain-containing protein n=1 Tax=Rhizobium laguerreae TaxID=1076926 RepID=A0ABR6G478_9HYPH|nr:hypothetical protein [Rhizobium laguerreae]OOO51951.1 hypothetical protein BS630_06105 [Rhizobium laguerreae]
MAGFDGGAITSDAGALLLRHVDKVIGLFERMAACFVDAALRLARSTVRTLWSGSASRRSHWDSSTSTTMTGCAMPGSSASVAVANKTACIIWALLMFGGTYGHPGEGATMRTA